MADTEKKNPHPRGKTLINADKRKPSSTGLLGRKGLLVIVSGNFFGKAFVLKKPSMTLGRREECDIVIPDDLLSRKHCRIFKDERGDYFIEDLSSTNSTWLNSKELKTKTALRYGDRLLLGNTIFRFFLEEDVEKK